jgi:hypothetical protein
MPKKAAGKKSKSRKKAPAKKRGKIRRGFIPH